MCAKNAEICEEQQSLSGMCHQGNAENLKRIQDGGAQMAPTDCHQGRVFLFYDCQRSDCFGFTSFKI